MDFDSTIFPLRPAWVEMDLARRRNNPRLIRRDLPRHVQLMAAVKDEACGRGALVRVRPRTSVVDVP
jgi:alanine racemase